jgi:hypothetical protein
MLGWCGPRRSLLLRGAVVFGRGAQNKKQVPAGVGTTFLPLRRRRVLIIFVDDASIHLSPTQVQCAAGAVAAGVVMVLLPQSWCCCVSCCVLLLLLLFVVINIVIVAVCGVETPLVVFERSAAFLQLAPLRARFLPHRLRRTTSAAACATTTAAARICVSELCGRRRRRRRRRRRLR